MKPASSHNAAVMLALRLQASQAEHRVGLQVSNPHSVPLAQVEEAAKLANAHEFIQSFPQAYHTQARRAPHMMCHRQYAALYHTARFCM